MLAPDLTTRQDLNGMINARAQRDSDSSDSAAKDQSADAVDERHAKDRPPCSDLQNGGNGKNPSSRFEYVPDPRGHSAHSIFGALSPQVLRSKWPRIVKRVWRMTVKFGTFIGPGFMVSVAYIDPGNYSTDVAAGAATKFRLLFIVLMSNVFAILLQTLAVRLGTVTGLNLAEHCRAHLPKWLNVFLYILGEAAIIATDIAEVSSPDDCLFGQ